jgi:hypothetical protein
MKNTYNILVGKYEGKRPNGRYKRRWEDNRPNKVFLKETGYEDMNWNHLAHDTIQLGVLVDTVINLRVPSKAVNFSTI